jgi:hypothetical protein
MNINFNLNDAVAIDGAYTLLRSLRCGTHRCRPGVQVGRFAQGPRVERICGWPCFTSRGRSTFSRAKQVMIVARQRSNDHRTLASA